VPRKSWTAVISELIRGRGERRRSATGDRWPSLPESSDERTESQLGGWKLSTCSMISPPVSGDGVDRREMGSQRLPEQMDLACRRAWTLLCRAPALTEHM
jgi:hypothetical protein